MKTRSTMTHRTTVMFDAADAVAIIAHASRTSASKAGAVRAAVVLWQQIAESRDVSALRPAACAPALRLEVSMRPHLFEWVRQRAESHSVSYADVLREAVGVAAHVWRKEAEARADAMRCAGDWLERIGVQVSERRDVA